MGQFQILARLTGPTGRNEEAELLVDAGSTLVVVPRVLAERLDLVIRRRQPVIIAGGTEAMWPIAESRVAVGDRDVPLESLFLAVDPVRRRLVPTEGFA